MHHEGNRALHDRLAEQLTPRFVSIIERIIDWLKECSQSLTPVSPRGSCWAGFRALSYPEPR